MKLYNYFIDNINKYYEFLPNNIINNISKLNLNESNHIILYGNEGSLKDYYVYYIINILTKTVINKNDIKLEIKTINVKNNNIEFNVFINKTFLELDLVNRSNYDRNIISKYIIDIIKNKNYKYDKHIIILRNFDKLTYGAFMSLRRIMELYSINVLFICICENLSIIPDAIKSRCFYIRCPIIEMKQLLNFIKIFLKDLNITNYEKKDINKLIKSCENDFTKILLKLDSDNYIFNINNSVINNNKDDDIDLSECLNNTMDINKDPIKYTDILDNNIKAHLTYLKKTKNTFLVLQKNREFIYTITYFNYNIQLILEKFLKIILKKYEKNIDSYKVIKLTADIDNDIINSSRDIYHFEKYLLNIYKMFHSIE